MVREELAVAPPVVRQWIASPPSWVEIRSTTGLHKDASMGTLDAGEEDAIALALEIHADLLLIDDREGVSAARRKGLKVIGTLGILALAARQGLIDLVDAFDRVKQTNFRYRQGIMDALNQNGLTGRQRKSSSEEPARFYYGW